MQEKVYIYSRNSEMELNYTKIYAELSKNMQTLI